MDHTKLDACGRATNVARCAAFENVTSLAFASTTYIYMYIYMGRASVAGIAARSSGSKGKCSYIIESCASRHVGCTTTRIRLSMVHF